LVSLLQELIGEISKIIVPTGTGPSGTPTNAGALKIISNKLSKCLSKQNYTL